MPCMLLFHLRCDLNIHGDTSTEPGRSYDSDPHPLTTEVILHDTGGDVTSAWLFLGIPDLGSCHVVRKPRLRGRLMVVCFG